MIRPYLDDLHTLLSELAEADAVGVALALVSLRPTRHLAELASGTRVHTWCALDALLVARLLDEDVEVTSRHRPDAEPLSFTVRDGQLVAAPSLVLSFPAVRAADGRPFTEAFCPYANVFPDLATYLDWAGEQPRHTTPLSLTDADRVAQAFAADVQRRGAAPCCAVA